MLAMISTRYGFLLRRLLMLIRGWRRRWMTQIQEGRLETEVERESCTVELGYQKRFYTLNNRTNSLDGPACSLLLFLLLLYRCIVLGLLILQVQGFQMFREILSRKSRCRFLCS